MRYTYFPTQELKFSPPENSSCSRTSSRLDSTNSYCASCNANLCSSVCRCSSPRHLLRDSTWSSCFIRSDLASDLCYFQEEVLSNSMGCRFWTQNSWSSFHVQMKTMRWVSPKLSDLQMNETSNFPFDRLECVVHLPLSPARPLHRVSPEAFWTYTGEVSIFCNSPSSRSESAMLSTESSKCICDWK